MKYLEEQSVNLRMNVVDYRDIVEDGMESTVVYTINHSPWHTGVEKLIKTLNALPAFGGDALVTTLDALGCLDSSIDEEHAIRTL